MSTYYWGADSPTTGAFKSHVVEDLFKASARGTVFFPLANKKSIPSGQTATIPIVDMLSYPTTTVVSEDEPLPIYKLTVTANTISPDERGMALQVSDMAVRRNPFDLLQENRRQLQLLMAEDLDVVVESALAAAQVKYVADGVASQTITSNGTAGAAALSNPNFYHMRYADYYMSDVLRIPRRAGAGGRYVAIFRGLGALSLVQDPEWVEMNQGMPDAFRQSVDKVGTIGGIMVLTVNNSNLLDNNIGTNSDVTEGHILGEDAVYWRVIQNVGVHFDFSDSAATNFGRFKFLAWYGDHGAGVPDTSGSAGLVRSMHWTST